MKLIRTSLSALAVSLGLAGAAGATPLGGTALAMTESNSIDLLTFQTTDPDVWTSLHRSSDSLPLTMTDVETLQKAGIAEGSLIEMMRTRRLLLVADADTLVRLKKGGASDALVTAVSAYALAPNRDIDLAIQVQVATPYDVRQAPYLYVELYDVDRKSQESFLLADVRRLLAQRWRVDTMEDRSDPLLPNRIRSLRLWGHAPARHGGHLQMRVLLSQHPGLTSLDKLATDDTKRVRTFDIDYPGVSLERACELQLDLSRDPMLKDLFNLDRADLRCRWD